MLADDYVHTVLKEYQLPTGQGSPGCEAMGRLKPMLSEWGGRYLAEIQPTGSYAKGTRIKGGTDIDILVSLGPKTPAKPKQLYDHLFNWLVKRGLAPKRRGVAVVLQSQGMLVDLIPGKLEWGAKGEHQLHDEVRDREFKTSPDLHVRQVLASHRMFEIRAAKVWRYVRGLRFPSFYLELAVIQALRGQPKDTIADNFLRVLTYLGTEFSTAQFHDPANAENLVSNDLTEHERMAIAVQAEESLKARDWAELLRYSGPAALEPPPV